jgi:hypothetical protein
LACGVRGDGGRGARGRRPLRRPPPAAGGPAPFDLPARRRLALYRVYLDLIMLVEMVPRKDDDADRERVIRNHLTSDLDTVQRAL